MTSTRGADPAANEINLDGIEIYGPGMSTFTRTIKLALIELDIPFKTVDVMPHSKEIVNLNPLGLAPVLIHRDCESKHGQDVVLYESMAIRRYIDEHLSLFRPESFPGPLTPTANERTVNNAVYARAILDQSVSVIASSVFPALEHGFIKPALAKKDSGVDDTAILEDLREAADKVKSLLSILERDTEGQYLSGQLLQWNDLFLFPILDDLRSAPLTLDEYPKLRKWFEVMCGRDSVKNTRSGTISEKLD